MKLSAFNLYVDDYPCPGEILVHNTFSGGFAVLGRDMLAALRKLDQGESPADEDAATSAVALELAGADVGIMVASLAAEEQEYRAWFERRRSRRVLTSLVSINMACNFECSYCCQAGVMDGAVMEPGTAAAVASWLDARAAEVLAEEIQVVFLGGEPLLHPGRIESIATLIAERAGSRGIEFGFALITNGYYLTEDMVQRLLPLGLCHAQVTIDGDHTTHSLSRISKRGEDTFARIFANTVAASRNIRITINGNYQDSTIAGFAPLLGKLAQAGLPAASTLRFTPALEIFDAPAGSGSGSCTWSGSSYWYGIALHDEILRHGYQTQKLDSMGPCGFHDRNLFAIDPRGNIYKCPGFLGHPEWAVGHVEQELSPRYQELVALDYSRSCGGCAQRPICSGGCVASEMVHSGELGGVSCERDYFDAVKPHALVRSYLLSSCGDREAALSEFPEPPVPLPRSSSAPTTGRGVRPAALRVL